MRVLWKQLDPLTAKVSEGTSKYLEIICGILGDALDGSRHGGGFFYISYDLDVKGWTTASGAEG
jgi:hypothetical protein